jgi:hypothetical protein
MKTFEAGKPILTMRDFGIALRKEKLLFVKGWNRTTHPIIFANMQYRIAKNFIERKQIFIAKKIEGGKHGTNKCSSGKTGTGGTAR